MAFQFGNDVSFPIFNSYGSENRLREVINDDGVVEYVEVLHSSSGNLYEIGKRQLGSALYGRVMHGVKLQGQDILYRTATHVAIKFISRKKVNELQGKNIENHLKEIAALQYIGNDNPHLVGYIECCRDDENVYSVMRFYSPGELYDMIALDDQPMNDATARTMVFHVIAGLEQLHRRGIGHRDLSADNVLVDFDAITNQLRFVVIDLGMCTMCPRRDEISDAIEDDQLTPISFKCVPREVCGKHGYMAPEVFPGDDAAQYVNPMLCDIWSLGIILFFSLTGNFPMEAALPRYEEYKLIVSEPNGLQQLVDHWGLPMSANAVDLIQRMLRADPNDRITIAQIREHPFMNSN